MSGFDLFDGFVDHSQKFILWNDCRPITDVTNGPEKPLSCDQPFDVQCDSLRISGVETITAHEILNNGQCPWRNRW
jgi:hypothetical protein